MRSQTLQVFRVHVVAVSVASAVHISHTFTAAVRKWRRYQASVKVEGVAVGA